MDEFDLPPRHDDERGGAPDYAVLWHDRLWMIELKTEVSSHRRGQLAGYYALAGHHHPGIAVDLTYVTPPFTVSRPSHRDGDRFAHLTWEQVIPLVEQVWGAGTDVEQSVVSTLVAAAEGIGTSWTDWRAQRVGTGEAAPVTAEAHAMTLAGMTGEDGQQRAVELPAVGLDELQRLRLALRQTICGGPSQSPLRHVLPWLWNAATSGGTALTATGQDTGYELRLSRYKKPQC